jgi:hypothetical protein
VVLPPVLRRGEHQLPGDSVLPRHSPGLPRRDELLRGGLADLRAARTRDVGPTCDDALVANNQGGVGCGQCWC